MYTMMNTNYFCLTCDVEGDPASLFNEIRLLIEVLDKYNISMTFFVSLENKIFKFEAYADILQEFKILEEKGHEIGLHIHWGHYSSSYVRSYYESLINFTDIELNDELVRTLNLMKS